MPMIGFSYGIIREEAVFRKLAPRYHVLMVATLSSLLMFAAPTRSNFDPADLDNMEMSKVNLRWVMGLLAIQMASAYFFFLILRAYHIAIHTPDRIFQELPMFSSFLSLILSLIHLYGIWGIVWLPVCPPIALVGLQVAISCLKKSSTSCPEKSLKKSSTSCPEKSLKKSSTSCPESREERSGSMKKRVFVCEVKVT